MNVNAGRISIYQEISGLRYDLFQACQTISFLNIHTLINKTNSTQCINSYKTAVHVHSKLVFLCLIFYFFYFSIIALYF